MSEAQSLARRVAELTGPDREVDALLYVRFECIVNDGRDGDLGPFDPAISAYLTAGTKIDWLPTTPAAAPRYTASLDAALALVERVRPGWQADLSITSENTCAGLSAKLNADFEPDFRARHLTPALALLAALLHSLDTPS